MRFRSVGASELGPLMRAFVSLLLVDLMLRLMPLQRVLDRAERGAADRSVGPQDLARARAYARWIDIAARHHIVRARCLHRSLALHARLRAEGLPSSLQIGVRKDGIELSAHAWVELRGEVVNDRPELTARFAPLSGRLRPILFGEGVGAAQWR